MSCRELIEACAEGDIAKIEYLLSRGVNPCDVSNNGQIPFLFAAQHGLTVALQLFVQYGADPEISIGEDYYIAPPNDSRDGWNALFFAVSNRHYDTAHYLLTRLQLDPNKADAWGVTPFMLAARNGDIKMLKLLIQFGANPYTFSQLDKNAIRYAIDHHRHQAVEYLITQLHFDPNTPDHQGLVPFLIAARNGDVDMLRLLVRLGADPHVADKNRRNALHLAVAHRQRLAAEYLIAQLHFDPDTPDHQGLVPFLIAAQNGDIEMIRRLIQLGADPTITDQNGRNAVHFAVLAGDCDMVQYLIGQLCLDPNIRDHEGITPLMIAAQNGIFNTIKHLVHLDANPYLTDPKGQNILHYAARNIRSNHIAPLIIRFHLDPNIQDHQGNTPLHIAMEKRNTIIAQTLIQLGANPHIPNHDGETPITMAQRDDLPPINWKSKPSAIKL